MQEKLRAGRAKSEKGAVLKAREASEKLAVAKVWPDAGQR